MDILRDFEHEFRRHKRLADQAMGPLDDEAFFRPPGAAVNPVALIVKHLAGNLLSRWTDFLTSDGEKPGRDRDREFVLSAEDSRDRLLSAWEQGWSALFDTLAQLRVEHLDRTITIRGEKHTAYQALQRGLTHAAYHVGQILYLARLLEPAGPWLTIAPGQSRAHEANYRK